MGGGAYYLRVLELQGTAEGTGLETGRVCKLGREVVRAQGSAFKEVKGGHGLSLYW